MEDQTKIQPSGNIFHANKIKKIFKVLKYLPNPEDG